MGKALHHVSLHKPQRRISHLMQEHYELHQIALVEVASGHAWRDGFIKRPPGIQVADNTGLYQKDLTGST